jgi:hypothetical protein
MNSLYANLQDSGTTRVLTLPMFESLNGSLDGWLLDRWYDSSARQYDAFFLQNLPANLSGAAAAAPGGGTVQYSVMANQTAIHGLPAAVTQASHAATALISCQQCSRCLPTLLMQTITIIE